MNALLDTPVDLAAIQFDDALLDLLGSGARLIPGDDELARVLIAWRREVVDEPIGELVDPFAALTMIVAGGAQ